jgi:hypothetical protein
MSYIQTQTTSEEYLTQRGDTKRAGGRTRAFAPRKTERKYAATTARRSDDYSNGRNTHFQIIVTL